MIEPKRRQRDENRAAVGRRGAALHQAIPFQAVDNGGGIAVGDQQQATQLGHGEVLAAAIERRHHVESRQGRVVIDTQGFA